VTRLRWFNTGQKTRRRGCKDCKGILQGFVKEFYRGQKGRRKNGRKGKIGIDT
jgi:hypothetical protein